jgi:cytochrome c553
LTQFVASAKVARIFNQVQVQESDMTLRILTMAGLFAALAGLTLPLHAEGDAAAGKDKTAMCAGCHGIAGFRTAYPETYHVPKLGGQNAAYIVSALKAYKAGDRAHPTMKAIAASLSEQDMADLAAYYSSAAGK